MNKWNLFSWNTQVFSYWINSNSNRLRYLVDNNDPEIPRKVRWSWLDDSNVFWNGASYNRNSIRLEVGSEFSIISRWSDRSCLELGYFQYNPNPNLWLIYLKWDIDVVGLIMLQCQRWILWFVTFSHCSHPNQHFLDYKWHWGLSGPVLENYYLKTKVNKSLIWIRFGIENCIDIKLKPTTEMITEFL